MYSLNLFLSNQVSEDLRHCTIYTKRLAQKEKPDYGDSEHSQIWNFSIFSGMGSKFLKMGYGGGPGEVKGSAPALPLCF